MNELSKNIISLIVLIIPLSVFVFSSSCSGQVQSPSNNPNGPLKVQQPTLVIDTVKIDSLDFNIILTPGIISIKFSNISLKNISAAELDKFIKDQRIAKISPKVHVETSEQVPITTIKEVLQILENNNMNRFNLITR